MTYYVTWIENGIEHRKRVLGAFMAATMIVELRKKGIEAHKIISK